MLRLLISVFVVAAVVEGSAQSIHRISWHRQPTVLTVSGGKVQTLGFDGASFDAARGYLPVYYIYEPLGQSGPIEARIVDATYESAEGANLTGGSFITSQPAVSSETVLERKRPYASISVLPFRLNPSTGALERLIEFRIEISQTVATQVTRRGQRFATKSVLASGTWYKFSTDANGIYKLDYKFLKDELGVPVDQIDPRKIRIYGNGGGILPELNSTFRHDDLFENAITVVGEEDGVFNSNDYVLMYGTGADQWYATTEDPGYVHRKHLYDTKACYFLTTNLGPGKRIATQAQSSSSATQSSAAFDERLFIEEELYKLTESGQEWYGQQFDRNFTSQSYTFNMPNIASEPVFVKMRWVGRCFAGSTKMRVSVNGVLLGESTVNWVPNEYYDPYGGASVISNELAVSSGTLTVKIDFTPSPTDVGSQGWLDYIEVIGRRQLKMSGAQMAFRDRQTVNTGAITNFNLQTSGITIWEITQPLEPKNQQMSSGSFRLATDSLRQFIAFDGSTYLTPEAIGQISNQDIHGTIGQPDLVIVTHKLFATHAERLASHHRSWDGLNVAVVELEQLYNEFSSGVQDVSAIRDMMKMLYERAGADEELPQYLILFGDGSYDYKNIHYTATENTNYVPTYQSRETLNRGTTFTSDDFFGMLDPSEGGDIADSAHKLDVAVGRLVAENAAEAQAVVDKIIHYATKGFTGGDCHHDVGGTFGSWRNVVTFIGDDEDVNIHIKDSDGLAKIIEENHPVYNVDKIYLDAYPQVSTSGGARYPDVNTAITNRIFSGTLIMNYIGHGGEGGWAHERILGSADVDKWQNLDRLPLLVTATCSFSKFDNPTIKTIGEKVFVKKDGGAIALVTTVRLVYSSSNQDMNSAFTKEVLRKTDGYYPRLGDVMLHAKNKAPSGTNNRKFILIGDPALTLAYPKHSIRTAEVDNVPFVSNGDTLKALAKVTIKGQVTDDYGNKLTNFNGVVFPTIYDKPVNITTLQNDGGTALKFGLQKNIIYKGKASVNAGDFSYTFVVPKDISYSLGSGKISYYAHTTNEDAHGYDSIVIGGTASNYPPDDLGPVVEIFMNDEKFAFGGLTNESPLLLVKLSDESGINTSGIAIGHDIAGALDDNDQNKIILNEFYEAELDNYQAGSVRYPLSSLTPGRHSMKVKAWDTYNNPGEGYTEFVVAESAELALAHVLNYPNPFTTRTTFWFEHNRPCEALTITIEIYTVSGKLVKTLRSNIHSDGYLVNDIEWDGLDEYGDPIGRGVYVYKLKVRAPDGSQANQFEKLVLLR